MIPKKIYQTWYSKDIPYYAKKNINKMKKINPDYEFLLYDDNDILEFIKKEYDNEILTAYEKLTVGASKADFFRYLILFKYGGIYLDLDSMIDKNLDILINDKEAIISREGSEPYFNQWFMIFCKEHPILKRVIEITTSNILLSEDKIISCNLTGPWGPYTKGINEIMNLEDLWNLEDEQINKKLESSHDEKLRKTVFKGIDYNGYATFKAEGSWTHYLFKSHWKWEQKSMLEKSKYYMKFFVIFSIFLIFIFIIKNGKYFNG